MTKTLLLMKATGPARRSIAPIDRSARRARQDVLVATASSLAILVLLGGCQSVSPAAQAPDADATAGTGGEIAHACETAASAIDPDTFVVLAASPADDRTILDVESLRLLTPSTTRWRVVAGSESGSEFAQVIAPADASERFGAPSARVEATSEHGAPQSPMFAVRMGDSQTLLLERTPSGGIEMPVTITHSDRAVSLFEPPLGIAASELMYGAPYTSRSAMRVVDERNRSREIQSGEATRTFTIVDRCRIRTVMGEFDVIRVEIDFRAKLSLASAQERAVQYIEPTLGVVAEERRKAIRAVGIFGRTVEQTIVRIE